MQKLIFVSAHSGLSKKGNEYSLVRFSDGIDSFVINNEKNIDVKGFTEGDEVDVEIHVKKGFGDTLKGVLVDIQ